jgi:hypothetical protein
MPETLHNPDGVDLAYARVDWEAERSAGNTNLPYWQWVDEQHEKNEQDELYETFRSTNLRR